MWATELRFTQVIAGPFRKSSRSTLRKVGESGLSHKGDGTRFRSIITLTARMCSPRPTAVWPALQTISKKILRQCSVLTKLRKHILRGSRKNKESDSAKGLTAITGNYVMIDHGKNEYSLYAHLQPGSVGIRVGDQVKAGDVIGKLGSSGNSTEPHLHFHVCDKPEPVDAPAFP